MFVDGMKAAFPRLCKSSSQVSTAADTPTTDSPGAESLHFGLVDMVAETQYDDYTLNLSQQQKQLQHKYFAQMKFEVSKNNDLRSKYGVSRSKNHIRITEGKTLLFMCSSEGVAPRNLLLELCGSAYDIPTWLENRRNNVFDDGYGYSLAASPKVDKYGS